MSFVPPDFGGFVTTWDPRRPAALIVRYGAGKVQEGMRLTPLNLLQLRKTLDGLIAQGEVKGYITEEHKRQSEQLPTIEASAADMPSKVMPRDQVDEIAGPD